MSKALPVYELGQWIKSDRNVGYIVARMSAANEWEICEDYANRQDVERFNGRGAGYVIQWVELNYTDTDAKPGDYSVTATTPRRLSWLRAETIAEKRYQPCENPVKVSTEDEKPLPDPGPLVHWACPPNAAIDASFGMAPSQPALPLDIDAATEATMRVAVALGNQAADWLRAKGLTP